MKLYFRILYNKQIWITGVFLWIKDAAPVFSRIRIRVTQKDRIRIRNTGLRGFQGSLANETVVI